MLSNIEIIRAAEEFLRKAFDESEYFTANPSAKSYRLEHSYRVANIGKTIAQKEGFDPAELVIACLLHDIAYCREMGSEADWLEHGRNSAKIVRPFLEGLGLPQKRIDDICFGIAIHVDDKADFEGESTPFAQSIGDADNIDRFDAYRIYEGLQRSKFSEMPLAEKWNKVSATLTRLAQLREMKLGTLTAEEIWKDRIDFNIAFYKKLQEQLDSSETIDWRQA